VDDNGGGQVPEISDDHSITPKHGRLPMPEDMTNITCSDCSTEGQTFPTIVMTPGGPDRLLAVCAACGRSDDHGPVDAEAAA
jgi:hypothetical protein